MFDKNTDLAGSKGEFHFGDLPGRPNAKNLSVEIGIFHARYPNRPTRLGEGPQIEFTN